MVAVNFVLPSEARKKVEIPAGLSLMEGALRGGIEGIDAECGGALACATCHVHVADEWLEKLPAPSEEEIMMLEFAIDPDRGSRLSCQLILDQSLDGLTIKVPERQK